jgi:hypothetical protein
MVNMNLYFVCLVWAQIHFYVVMKSIYSVWKYSDYTNYIFLCPYSIIWSCPPAIHLSISMSYWYRVSIFIFWTPHKTTNYTNWNNHWVSYERHSGSHKCTDERQSWGRWSRCRNKKPNHHSGLLTTRTVSSYGVSIHVTPKRSQFHLLSTPC